MDINVVINFLTGRKLCRSYRK